jgi:predicted PolB exonuclease-like 3'-5' exonuclease
MMKKPSFTAFFELIEKYTPQLVSWNGSGFDLPVLHYRAMLNQVAAPRYWEMGESNDSDSKDFKWNNYINRYHMRHIDLMDVLAKHNGRANAPLDAIAKVVWLPRKNGNGWKSSMARIPGGAVRANPSILRDRCGEHLFSVLPLSRNAWWVLQRRV